MKKLEGLIAAAHTPFNADGSVNLALVKKQAQTLIKQKVTGVYPPGPQRAPHAQSRGRSSRPRRRPRPPLCGSLRALPPPLLFAGPGPGSDGSPGARGPAATPPPPGTRRSAGSPAAPQVRGRGRGTLILKGAPPAVVCTLTQWKALGRRSACYQLHVVPAAAVSPGG